MKRIVQAINDLIRFENMIVKLSILCYNKEKKIKVELTEKQLGILITCAEIGFKDSDELRKAFKREALSF